MVPPKTPDQIYGQRDGSKYAAIDRERHRQRVTALK